MNSWEPRKNLKCTDLLNQFREDLMCEMLRLKKRTIPKKLDTSIVSHLVQRAKLRQTLKLWENHLNSLGSNKGRIYVENLVDMEGPPKNFTYINDYKVGDGISLNEMAVGCECTDCLDSPLNGCCAGASQHKFAYNDSGQVRVRPGLPIYECNRRCRCGPDCPNRVVQRGIQYSLCIFRTNNGRGWGVRTKERIRKNTFVMEYVGEVMAYSLYVFSFINSIWLCLKFNSAYFVIFGLLFYTEPEFMFASDKATGDCEMQHEL